MKYISALTIALVVCIGLVSRAGAAEIKLVSTSFDASYSQATSYNDNFFSNDSIDHAENFGFGMEMKFKVGGMVNLNFGFNYTPMRVSEYDPKTAFSRSNFPYWPNHWNRTQWYINAKHPDGTPIFDVAYDYQYHMKYINMPIGIEIAPLAEKGGMFQPFIGAGVSPAMFQRYAYWVTDITGHFRNTAQQYVGDWHYRIRAHANTRNKHRGWIMNGYAVGGVNIKITEGVGFQAKIRYFQTIADNDRNRITGFYNINAGIVVFGI